MPNIYALIGTSWRFMQRQSAVIPVTSWFLFLPMLLSAQLVRLSERSSAFSMRTPESSVTVILLTVLLGLIFLWGNTCILLVGRRLLQAKSGRSRSSFRAVRIQAGSYFLPLLLTSILRLIFTILWALLLVIPGIIYSIRTIFAPVIVVGEGIAYRDALSRSKEIVHGHFWNVTASLVLLILLIFLPVELIDTSAKLMAKDGPFYVQLAADIVGSLMASFGTTLFLLSLIQLYSFYRPGSVVSVQR